MVAKICATNSFMKTLHNAAIWVIVSNYVQQQLPVAQTRQITWFFSLQTITSTYHPKLVQLKFRKCFIWKILPKFSQKALTITFLNPRNGQMTTSQPLLRDKNEFSSHCQNSHTYLQGKSFSLLQSAIQFSLDGRRPLFLAYWSMAKPSTDSKVQARRQVGDGRHSFWM